MSNSLIATIRRVFGGSPKPTVPPSPARDLAAAAARLRELEGMRYSAGYGQLSLVQQCDLDGEIATLRTELLLAPSASSTPVPVPPPASGPSPAPSAAPSLALGDLPPGAQALVRGQRISLARLTGDGKPPGRAWVMLKLALPLPDPAALSLHLYTTDAAGILSGPGYLLGGGSGRRATPCGAIRATGEVFSDPRIEIFEVDFARLPREIRLISLVAALPSGSHFGQFPGPAELRFGTDTLEARGVARLVAADLGRGRLAVLAEFYWHETERQWRLRIVAESQSGAVESLFRRKE